MPAVSEWRQGGEFWGAGVWTGTSRSMPRIWRHGGGIAPRKVSKFEIEIEADFFLAPVTLKFVH